MTGRSFRSCEIRFAHCAATVAPRNLCGITGKTRGRRCQNRQAAGPVFRRISGRTEAVSVVARAAAGRPGGTRPALALTYRKVQSMNYLNRKRPGVAALAALTLVINPSVALFASAAQAA